jgi:hypothetical protein
MALKKSDSNLMKNQTPSKKVENINGFNRAGDPFKYQYQVILWYNDSEEGVIS